MRIALRSRRTVFGGGIVAASPRALLKAALLVLIVSLGVRITCVACSTVTPISDFAGYDRMAVRLLAEWEFGGPSSRAYRTPGYPCFLMLIYSVFGHSWKAAGFVQAVLGGITSVALVLLVAQFAGVRTASIAGLLHAFCPTSLAYVPVLASENLAVFLIVLGLLFLGLADLRAGWRRNLAVGTSGAALGLLLLTRPAGLFFLPAWLLLIVYSPRMRVFRVRSALLFVVTVGVVLSPWLIRNYKYGLGPFTLSTVGPLNLYMGNNDLTSAGGFCDEADRKNFSKLGERERARAYLAATLDWVHEHPGRYAELCKCRLARHMGIIADSWAERFLLPTAEVNQAHLAVWADRRGKKTAPESTVKLSWDARRRNAVFLEGYRLVVAPLSLLALCLSIVRWRRFAIVVWPACFYILGLTLTFGSERFRQLSDPLLLIPVAALLSDLLFGTRDLGRRPSRVSKLAATSVVLALCFWGHTTRFWDRLHVLPPSCAPAPDVSDLTFQRIGFEEPASQYKSSEWTLGVQELRLALEGASLRCGILGDPAKHHNQHAGIQTRVRKPKAIRLTMTWINPTAILAVFVDGYDAAGTRLPLWSWDFGEDTMPREAHEVYVLVPGHRSGYFTPREESGPDTTSVVSIHLFVKVRPNAETGFVLHSMEVASD